MVPLIQEERMYVHPPPYLPYLPFPLSTLCSGLAAGGEDHVHAGAAAASIPPLPASSTTTTTTPTPTTTPPASCPKDDRQFVREWRACPNTQSKADLLYRVGASGIAAIFPVEIGYIPMR